jgi:hypothetical protein
MDLLVVCRRRQSASDFESESIFATFANSISTPLIYAADIRFQLCGFCSLRVDLFVFLHRNQKVVSRHVNPMFIPLKMCWSSEIGRMFSVPGFETFTVRHSHKIRYKLSILRDVCSLNM